MAFDINRDKVFTDSDLVNGSIPSGLKVCQGIPTRFRFQLTAPAKITANVTISDGSIVSLLMLSNKAQAKRYTWRKTF